jgi:glycolate oxidase iron-sulfur subunit
MPDRSPPAHTRAAAEATGAPDLVDLAQSVGAADAETTARATAPDQRSVAVLPAVDGHHPPARALIDDCVHCGFCLPSCPTYLLFGEEMDSPRGRIYLMKEGLEGELLSESMVRHIALCQG